MLEKYASHRIEEVVQILTPLTNGPIARLWAGLSLATVGDQLYRIALAWLLVEWVGPAAGFVSAVECVAVLAVALFAGPWIDRRDERQIMIAADLIRAGLALAPVIAAALGRLSFWTLVVPSVALAGLRSVFDPALQASLPRLARERKLLLGTNALMDATARIGRLVGPSLAGVLAGLFLTVELMAVTAFCFLFSALTVMTLRRTLPKQSRAPTAGSTRDLLLRGVRAASARPSFIYLLWSGGIVSGLWIVAIWVCLPLVIRQDHIKGFGVEGLTAVALVMAGYGIGNLISNLIVGNFELRKPASLIVAGNYVVGVGLALMGATAALAEPGSALAPLVTMSALTAIGGPMTDIPMATLRQTLFSEEEIAAVYRLEIVSDWTGTLAATLCAPLLLHHIAASTLMLACGAGIVAVSLIAMLVSGMRTLSNSQPGQFKSAGQSPALCE